MDSTEATLSHNEMVFESVFLMNGNQLIRTANGFILCNVLVNGERQVRAILEETLLNFRLIDKDDVAKDIQDKEEDAIVDMTSSIKDIQDKEEDTIVDMTSSIKSDPSSSALSSLIFEQVSDVKDPNKISVELKSSVPLENNDDKQVTVKPTEWGPDDSKLLLEQYATYMKKVGPLKLFRTKKEMFAKIASDIELELAIKWSGVQCETRYRTIMKRKRESEKNNQSSGATRREVQFENEISKISANDDSLDPEVRRGVGKVIVNAKPVKKVAKRNLSSTDRLINLLEQKEIARERRHKEQMAIFIEKLG